MRHAARALAATTMIAAACWAGITQASPRAHRAHRDRASVDAPAFAPIETIIDWLEAAYGGPIGRDTSR